jgi:hypothetical protein
VSLTEGSIENKNCELLHLKSMAMNHLKWYEYYQSAYQVLLEKNIEKE